MPHMFRSLLIPIDLSPGSERVLGRVARLPLAEGARLTLLHVVPKSLPRDARGLAETDARKALATHWQSLSQSLPKGVIAQQVVKVGVPAAEIARHARAARAELIVMGRGGGRPLSELFLGSTAERVIRRGQLPVLVVRLPPRTPYQRPALAVDRDEAARDVLTLLLRVVALPRPRVALIHAYEAPYHGLIYPSLSAAGAEEYRGYYRQKALKALMRLVATTLTQARVLPKDAPVWKTYLRYGSPRSIIEKTVKTLGTDLLVLGTHGHTGVAHAFLGTVAGDVLREVPCDVLVVPPRGNAPRAA